MRPFWKGYLKLALVSGPPRLLTRDVIIVGAAQPPANSLHSNTVRWLCVPDDPAGRDRVWADWQRRQAVTLCSLAFANVQQRLLPKNSPKRLKE